MILIWQSSVVYTAAHFDRSSVITAAERPGMAAIHNALLLLCAALIAGSTAAREYRGQWHRPAVHIMQAVKHYLLTAAACTTVQFTCLPLKSAAATSPDLTGKPMLACAWRAARPLCYWNAGLPGGGECWPRRVASGSIKGLPPARDLISRCVHIASTSARLSYTVVAAKPIACTMVCHGMPQTWHSK